MIKVFTSQHLTEIELLRGVLEDRGIASTLKNQYSSIARGEIPFTESWPELWILDATDLEKAQAAIAESRNSKPSQEEAWICAECGEESEGQFSSCWNCQTEKPSETA